MRAAAFAFSLVAMAACTRVAPWTGPRAVFPFATRTTVVPLRDPLVLRGGLLAEATVYGRANEPVAIPVVIDSGASGVVLAEPTVRRLALTPLDGVRSIVQDAAGHTRTFQPMILPQLTLGELVARDVVVDAIQDASVIGQAILEQAPWEIDWDRGSLTLDAPEWSPEDETIVRLPMRHDAIRGGDFVTATIDGRPLEMLVDTGALTTALPEHLAQGLPRRDIAFPITTRLPGGPVTVRELAEAELSLGGLRLGRRNVLLVPGDSTAHALLGLDVLSLYAVHVVPGRSLALRPRRRLSESAAARASRWPWTSACARPGCATARVEPSRGGAQPGEADATLVLTIDPPQGYPVPVEVLFGCPDDDAAFVSTPQIMMQGGSMKLAGFHHVAVYVPAHVGGGVETTLRLGGRLWLDRSGACRDLAVLDVVPQLDDGAGATPLTAHFL